MSQMKWGKAFLVGLSTALLCSSLGIAQTESKEPEDPARKEAFRVYDAGRYVDAMPLLENYVTQHPDDLVAKEHWAYSVLQYGSTLSDAGDRKKARALARALAIELKKAGDQSDV
jgi:hypothetical protein